MSSELESTKTYSKQLLPQHFSKIAATLLWALHNQ